MSLGLGYRHQVDLKRIHNALVDLHQALYSKWLDDGSVAQESKEVLEGLQAEMDKTMALLDKMLEMVEEAKGVK